MQALRKPLSQAVADSLPGGSGPSGPQGPSATILQFPRTKKPPRECSPAGIAFIQHWEGLPGGHAALTAYQDSKGVWTIGWGHTAGVHEGMTCSLEAALAWLDADLDEAESAVCLYVTVPLTDNQFDALASLVYNIGTTAFRSSTLLRKLNARDYAGAAAQFAAWNKVTIQGQLEVSNGLTNRRTAEAGEFTQASGQPMAPVAPFPSVIESVPHTEAPKVEIANEVPTPPPAKLVQVPGAKPGILALLTGGGGLLTSGFDQVQPTLNAVHRIMDGIASESAVVRVIGAVLVLTSVGALAYGLWRQRQAVHQ